MTELSFVQAPDDACQPGPGAGDGVFETVRIHAGVPTLWKAHLQRLRRGLDRLGLAPDPSFEAQLGECVRKRVNLVDDGVLRVVVTAAAGSGYRRREPVQLQVCLQLRDAPAMDATFYEAGVRVRTCAQRLARQPVLAGIKHLNRLEQILATRELTALQAEEGVMLDSGDRVIEGTRTNLFLHLPEGWVTPSLEQCGVQGTMRDALLDALPAAGIPVTVTAMAADRLPEVDEMFVCNSVLGVWPVQALDGRALAVGPTTRLARQLAAAMLAPGSA